MSAKKMIVTGIVLDGKKSKKTKIEVKEKKGGKKILIFLLLLTAGFLVILGGGYFYQKQQKQHKRQTIQTENKTHKIKYAAAAAKTEFNNPEKTVKNKPQNSMTKQKKSIKTEPIEINNINVPGSGLGKKTKHTQPAEQKHFITVTECSVISNEKDVVYYFRQNGHIFPVWKNPSWNGKGITVMKGQKFYPSEITDGYVLIDKTHNIWLPQNYFSCQKIKKADNGN